VCSDYKSWQNTVREPGRIAMNLSLRQLKQSSFLARCRNAFRKHGVSPTSFELEVTETTLMTDPTRTIGLLNELYALGLHLAIDDFGTGYSSLAHLKRLPVNEVKIDRSFIKELEAHRDDDVIVRSTINLGHALNLKVVAEGVEVASSWKALRRLGCDLIQGYYVSKPLPAQEFTAWMAARTTDDQSASVEVPIINEAQIAAARG
jgi:EAL domain-containing protein (putative c-di-GMP-specific phosphodiesterase class I)